MRHRQTRDESKLGESELSRRHDTSDKTEPTRALVIEVGLPRGPGGGSVERQRTIDARLAEVAGLAAAIDLEVVEQGIVTLSRIRPATLIGTGKVEELAGVIRAETIDVVVVDAALSPVQQRNLERAWKAKVVDRTGLILEIFAARANTREGRLQVELAQLTYQKSRLVRSWTHLERQRGGLGTVGGPGETQIEADRRMIQERITALKAELSAVVRTRALHRAGRARVPYPVVAIVGYTNAGKSTLFNRLTKAGVRAEDLLFATLDPTMRRLKLPHGGEAILSDTVGFISDLPTHLIAAFRATLEEVTSADLILHVRDISHQDTAAQADDVVEILGQLLGESRIVPVIEVWNKIDTVDPDSRAAAAARARSRDDVVAISAATGEGLDQLLAAIEERLAKASSTERVVLAPTAGRTIHWIYENCEVLARHERDAGAIELEVRIPPAKHGQFTSRISAEGNA